MKLSQHSAFPPGLALQPSPPHVPHWFAQHVDLPIIPLNCLHWSVMLMWFIGKIFDYETSHALLSLASHYKLQTDAIHMELRCVQIIIGDLFKYRLKIIQYSNLEPLVHCIDKVAKASFHYMI